MCGVLLPQSNLWRLQKRLVYRLCIGLARGEIGIIWKPWGRAVRCLMRMGMGTWICILSMENTGRAGGENALYRNDGGFRFTAVDSGASGVGYGMGCTVGDYDNDGDLDLYTAGYDANVLYQNDGRGGFVEKKAGVGGGGMVCWCDLF